jgi:hypothetical protein
MVLPIDTILGKLEMGEVYEYYDCPRLFMCKNEIGKDYIGLSVEDNDGYQVWIYVALSKDRLNNMEANKITLRDVFLTAEEKFVLEVTTYNSQPDTAHMLICADIQEKFLPEEGIFLMPAEKI